MVDFPACLVSALILVNSTALNTANPPKPANLSDLEEVLQRLVEESERIVSEAGASEMQQRYLACYAWSAAGTRGRSAWDLFPEIAAYHEEHGLVTADLRAEAERLAGEIGVSAEAYAQIAQGYSSYVEDFSGCSGMMIEDYELLRVRASQLELCAEYLRDDLSVFDDVPFLESCPHYPLLEPLPEFVASYQSYLAEFGGNSFIGAQLPEGWAVTAASIQGQPSRHPNHCSTGMWRFELENAQGDQADIVFGGGLYALREAPSSEQLWEVYFPASNTTVSEFCEQHSVEPTSISPTARAQSPIEVLSGLINPADE